MNKGREGKAAAPSTDLLVCFPSRTHLRLMPKAICSPVRPLEPNKLHRHHQRKRSISRAGSGGQTSSPMLWTKSKSTVGSENSEPTSPKVTCAGQIKVRHKNTASRSWQSVMEEIEKIHNNKKQKKRLNWAESLGFKKEIMHFFTCLRAVRFDFRCFGSFSGTDIVTEDEEEDDDGEDEDEVYYKNDHVGVEESPDNDDNNESSRAVFSKWFMVLQENQNNEVHKEEEKKEEIGDGDEDGDGEIPVPPPNALLLMRCRSAPANSWLTEREEEVHGNNNEKENISHKEKVIEKELSQTHVKKGQSLKSLMEEETTNKKENLLVMRYNPEFYGISTDIAAETWIVGGLPDPMSRSRSWKR
ncbi:unnamed protein product [Lathyrus sativus]|nr:unnamed protein product [Lathyrus sativus]